jgi:outer membrane lipoprotein
MRKKIVLASAAGFLLVCAGCAPTFSSSALNQVDRGITFQELQSSPDLYIGKWVLLGGMIIETRNTREGTFIEVLQTPIGRRGRPEETDQTAGRFIISSPQFLDGAVYRSGKRISVVGEVSGHEVRPLGQIHYQYPVVVAKELQLWEPRSEPSVSFGFGIGIFHGF